MSELTLTEQEQIRREKLKELEAMGIDPFGEAFERNSIVKSFSMLILKLLRKT